MARYACIFYNFGWIVASILAMVASVEVSEALAVPWLGFAVIFLVVAVTLSLMVGFYWLARGGKGPRLAAALFVPAHRITFGWLVLINSAICRLRAATGPGRDLFRGITHLRQGELEQAVEAFERHMRRSPKELSGLYYATMAFAKLGRFGEALRYLDTAVQQGAHPDALLFRCLVFLAVGANEEALQDVGAALRQGPNNRVYHFYHALALVQAGRADEALEVMRGPASPRRFHLNWWTLSLVLQEKGDTSAAADARCRALAFLATVRTLGPMPWDQSGEGEILARMGKLEQGEKAAARTLARSSGDPDALTIQALIHALRGETEDILKPLERASQRNPFAVVHAARDPSFAPLMDSPGFAPLLEQATSQWEAELLAIRSRPGIAQSGP